MWILIMFDMPTETKTEKRKHKAFLKNLLEDDFTEVLSTVYARNCASEKSAATHWKHIKEILPLEVLSSIGTVKLVTVSDEQFANIKTHQFYNFGGAGIFTPGCF